MFSLNVLFKIEVGKDVVSHSLNKRISVFQFVSARSASGGKKIRLTVFLPLPKDISSSDRDRVKKFIEFQIEIFLYTYK